MFILKTTRKQKRFSFISPGLLLTALVVLACASPARAGDEDELFFDMPIVLSANRLEQKVEDAAVSISVIDREMIEASGARSIPEVLRLIPGMQVGYSGNEFGDEPKYVVSYHGHTEQYSKQMQVLIDGRSIYNPFFGGILWKAAPINIDDIERIEVSRGPNLATYGANAFLASINIITRTAAEDQGSYIRTNLGDHRVRDLTYRYGHGDGKLDYRITIGTMNDRGLDSANNNPNPDASGRNNIDYRIDYQINDTNSLSYQGGYGNQRQQSDRNHEAVLPTARTVTNIRFFQFFKWESTLDTKNAIQLQYYYNLYDKDDRYLSDTISVAGVDPFELNIDASIRSERHNLELTHFFYPGDDLKLVWGASLQTDFVRSPTFLNTDSSVRYQQYRVFANTEWFFNPSNIINFGVLAENNEANKTSFSPRLSFTHIFNPNHRIRIGISQAIRSPFVYEAKADVGYSHALTLNGAPVGITARDQIIIGNENLNNEKIISQEIAYYGNFLNGNLMFNGRLFHDRISNFIDTLREDVNDPAIDNIDNTRLYFTNPISSSTNGLEVELNYRPAPDLRIVGSGAIIHIISNSHAASISAPRYSYSLLAIKQFDEQYSASTAYYYVEDFTWMDSSSTGKYKILDLRATRHFHLARSPASLSIVVKNLLDDYSDYRENPRNGTSPKIIHNTAAYIDFRVNF